MQKPKVNQLQFPHETKKLLPRALMHAATPTITPEELVKRVPDPGMYTHMRLYCTAKKEI
jgi:hypothetical protein